MRRIRLVGALLALSLILAAAQAAWSAGVYETSWGSREGECCRLNRARTFERPDGEVRKG